MVLEDLLVCESCIKDKMTKGPFIAKRVIAKNKCLSLVHTDVCEPFNAHAGGGYEYFNTFTDDYSRYGFVYLMHRKSNGMDKFKEF